MEHDGYIPDGTDSGHFSIKNHRFSAADPDIVWGFVFYASMRYCF